MCKITDKVNGNEPERNELNEVEKSRRQIRERRCNRRGGGIAIGEIAG